MSVTAVPLRPIAKGSLTRLWIGVAVLAAVGGLAAWKGTAETIAKQGGPDQFLAWNAGRAGVKTTASGLQYKVIEAGDVASGHPTAQDVVLVKYAGRLRDGTVFDQNDQAPLELGRVIPGWAEGLQLMSKGAKYRFWIPPKLGYGEAGAGGVIPPNEVLDFDVELIDFIPAAALRQQMQGLGLGGGAPHGEVPARP